MKFAFLVVLITAMFVSMTTSYRFGKADNPAKVATAVQQVNQYRVFMYVATQFMTTYSGGPKTLYWKDIRNTPGAPTGTTNGGMPTTWKIVVASDATWVACTEMDEKALGMLQQLSAPSGLQLNRASTKNANYIVIGQQADIPKSAQCN